MKIERHVKFGLMVTIGACLMLTAFVFKQQLGNLGMAALVAGGLAYLAGWGAFTVRNSPDILAISTETNALCPFDGRVLSPRMRGVVDGEIFDTNDAIVIHMTDDEIPSAAILQSRKTGIIAFCASSAYHLNEEIKLIMTQNVQMSKSECGDGYFALITRSEALRYLRVNGKVDDWIRLSGKPADSSIEEKA